MFDKLIDFLLDFLKLFRCCRIVFSYQRGVLMRFGKFHHVMEPGLRFFWPFMIDTPMVDQVTLETMNTCAQSLTTKDGIGIVISTVVTFRIVDIKTFLLDIEGRENVIEDCTYGVTSSFISSRTWEELQTDASKEITKAVRAKAKRYGVEIVDVALSDFSRCRSLRLFSPIQVQGRAVIG
jgi:membrane protease subunit HflK